MPNFHYNTFGILALKKTDHIIDVGGGASTLVDDLITDGFEHITVLDISANALKLASERLASRTALVNWIEADITQADNWHDNVWPSIQNQTSQVAGHAFAHQSKKS